MFLVEVDVFIVYPKRRRAASPPPRLTRKIGFEEKYYVKFDVGLVRSIILNSSDPERENIES